MIGYETEHYESSDSHSKADYTSMTVVTRQCSGFVPYESRIVMAIASTSDFLTLDSLTDLIDETGASDEVSSSNNLTPLS